MRRVRWLAIVSVLAVVAAGCGRESEETQPDSSSDTTAPSTDSTGGGGGEAELGLDDGAFGDLGVICQPAPEGTTLSAGTDPGVTESSIQISTFSDPGFTGRPGLNQEMFDTAEAFTRWCNEHGGINGRKIDLKLRDAKLTEFQQRVIEACEEGDFFSVGGGAVFDDTGQADRLACGLPIVYGYAVTTVASDADNSIQPIPNPGNMLAVANARYVQQQYPDTVSKAGLFTASVETTIVQAEKTKEAMESMGFTFVYEGQYNPLGETSWRPYLEAMRSAGVRGLRYVGEPVNLSKVLTEAASLGITFDWVLGDANIYDPGAVEGVGNAADALIVQSAFHPFLSSEDAADNLATRQYQELIGRYDEGGKIANLGIQGLSAWLLFAKAANECGVDLTRDCVMEKMQSVREWTGGGMHSPQNLADKTTAECHALIGVEAGTFVLIQEAANNGIYNCDPANAVELQGSYGDGAKCPNPAYATDPKPSNCA